MPRRYNRCEGLRCVLQQSEPPVRTAQPDPAIPAVGGRGHRRRAHSGWVARCADPRGGLCVIFCPHVALEQTCGRMLVRSQGERTRNHQIRRDPTLSCFGSRIRFTLPPLNVLCGGSKIVSELDDRRDRRETTATRVATPRPTARARSTATGRAAGREARARCALARGQVTAPLRLPKSEFRFEKGLKV